MKKSKIRSDVSMRSSTSDGLNSKDVNTYIPPLDVLTVKVLSLRLPSEDLKQYAIKVAYFDQLILNGTIIPIGKDEKKLTTQIVGTLNYDPSDYEKMCLYADNPLVVMIQPLKSSGSPAYSDSLHPSDTTSSKTYFKNEDISVCNIDILPMFIDTNKMCVRKRMQPMIKRSALNSKSWDNLPLVTLELSVVRHPANAQHHGVLKYANYMKVTLVAAYNMIVPFDEGSVYTAASKTPLSNEMNTGLVIYNQGYKAPKRFSPLNFYPHWESLRLAEDSFTDGEEKLAYKLDDLQNDHDIDLKHYLTRISNKHTAVWGSFHRTLMLENADRWLFKHLRRYQWPLEIHIYGEQNGYSFMTHMDLFKLLYPGVSAVRLAVPLYWIDPEAMRQKCDCELLLTPNDKAPSTSNTPQKRSKGTPDSGMTSSKTEDIYERPTGADDGNAFVIVEVKLGRPLKKPIIPPHISELEISEMLTDMEQGINKRKCNGRGQLDRNWHSTVRAAANSLRKVPQYGMTEFCAFSRQLSETRTRVELSTSFWQDSAAYVNNNFVVQEYLQSDCMFEEMLMMSHACLMRSACNVLVGVTDIQDLDPTLRAARHARQLQDTSHAMDLYLQLVIEKPCDSDAWRELATCLQDVDRDWASVCVDESVELNPRHPLTLLSKGCMVFEDDPAAAEPFFVALLSLYPLWTIGWVAANAYYYEREMYDMADQIMVQYRKTRTVGMVENVDLPRAWERELGDWWDHTPLLPGMNVYYDVADLLLRLRAINLAEICLARALLESGETAAYYHLVSLCCRLRGDVDDALCHIQRGLQKFGEISYLRSLEAECLHKKKECATAMTSMEKAGSCLGPFSILLSMPIRDPPRARSVLVDLLRRHPSAYAWIALADDWMMLLRDPQRSATGEGGDACKTDEQTAALTCAVACAVQALKWDRRAGRAWALLARLVRPRARRLYCWKMAAACGIEAPVSVQTHSGSQQSLCNVVGAVLRECRCVCLCEKIKF